ncbi:MAG: class I SAM-dependent methyltransferase [Bacteroidetes bacterium]|nr:class I SAM-dependent methyltransferase [Bacteroidota bacterium]
MRSLIKRLLRALGLLKAGRVVYSFVNGLSPVVVATELRVRLTSSGVPVPPGRLIFFVIGYRWAKVFLDSGALIVGHVARQLEANGCKLSERTAILDFGCGCGRLIRHLSERTGARLYGCDYNGELIKWDQEHLRFAEFKQNSLEPPLPYESESFDLIYARSVFTHLSEALQHRWLDELRRVLQPGGYLYFTTHGVQFLHRMLPEDRKRYDAGEVVVYDVNEEGHNVCSSFESERYVRERLSTGFEVVAYFPGESTPHLQQDGYLLRKR